VSPLVFGNELVIGQPLLVQLGLLLMKVSLSSFSFGFLLGYACAPIGDLCLLGPLVCRFAMLVRDVLAALPQLPLAGRNSRPFTGAWQYQSKADQYQHDDDNHDDQRCGHQLTSSEMDAKRVPVARARTNVISGSTDAAAERRRFIVDVARAGSARVRGGGPTTTSGIRTQQGA
jgi:hypothetical protein